MRDGVSVLLLMPPYGGDTQVQGEPTSLCLASGQLRTLTARRPLACFAGPPGKGFRVGPDEGWIRLFKHASVRVTAPTNDLGCWCMGRGEHIHSISLHSESDFLGSSVQIGMFHCCNSASWHWRIKGAINALWFISSTVYCHSFVLRALLWPQN